MQQTQTYRERSRAFLSKANSELQTGDLEQASEKCWGAAAMIVKAVADANSLDHQSHRELFAVVNHLARDNDDPELARLFQVANSLHINFYEHWQPAEMVATGLADVERFVAKVEQLLVSS